MSGPVEIRIQRLPGTAPDWPLPGYATPEAAGADLRAHLPEGAVELAPGARAVLPTGIACEIPQGFEIQVRPRSGLALKHGIMLVNAPGTIDSDYRGELGVILLNAGQARVEITHGQRIAQLVVSPAPQADFVATAMLSSTTRASGGFGSTGGH